MKTPVVFFHGYGSSSNNTKFSAIQGEKYCITVDYANTDYEVIRGMYSKLIESHSSIDSKPILVGHSLGGYWAIVMGYEYNLPIVLINPCLNPHGIKKPIEDLSPYHIISKFSNFLDTDAPKFSYVELGDEVLNVDTMLDVLENHTTVIKQEGGHHRIQYLDRVTDVVNFAKNEINKE